MAAFRAYLESRAADLANNQDLAPYFALPYVPDLSKHPSFKNLFLVHHSLSLSIACVFLSNDAVDLPQDSWTVELKARLVQFLKSTLSGPTDEPQLVNLYLDVS